MRGLVFLVASSIAAGQTEQSQSDSARCGSYCLYVSLRALDLVTESYSSFDKRFPPLPPNGYSLNELEELAKQFGAHTLALEADLEALSRISGRTACIAYLSNHFVIVSNIDEPNDKVSIIDPPSRYDQTLRQFRQTYSRRALVIGREPISLASSGVAWRVAWLLIFSAIVAVGLLTIARSLAQRRRLAAMIGVLLVTAAGGCRPGNTTDGGLAGSRADPPTAPTVGAGLKIEPQHYHAGKVFVASTDQKLSMSVQLINETDDPIRIIELRKTCTCTSVSVDNSLIPPFGRATLNASIRLGNTPGRDATVITVLTSLPGDPGKPIACDWELVTPLHAVPDAHEFGRLDIASSASARLALWNRGVTFCRKCEVHVDADRSLVAARFEAVPRFPRIEEHTDVDISQGPDRQIGTLLLELQPQSETGSFTRVVEVAIQCGGASRAALSIPIAWSIRPPVEVRPARLWLGFSPPDKKVDRRVSIRANDGTKFRVSSVTTKSGQIRAEAWLATESGAETFIELTLGAPGQPGSYRGELEIGVDGKSKSHLTLPVSLIVRRE